MTNGVNRKKTKILELLTDFGSSIDFSTGKVTIADSNKLNVFNHIVNKIEEKEYNIAMVDDTLQVKNLKTSFGLPYSIQYLVKEDGNNISVTYKINSQLFIPVTICLVIVCAFFSKFAFSGFLKFSSIIVLMFHLVYLMQTRSIAVRFLENIDSEDNIGVSFEDQKRWMNDPDRCPACGNQMNKYQWICDDCGLMVREKKHINRFSSTSTNYNFKYIYEKKSISSKLDK